MEQCWVVETEGQAIADALVGNHAGVLVREAREFVLVGQWADVHDEDSLTARDGAGRVLPGTERARQLGGHGTAKVAEFACADLAVLLGRGYVAASNLVRDALDVRERHPLLWSQIAAVAAADPAAVADGRVSGVQVWQAREVAKACHVAGLTRGAARWVDQETTPLIATMPWGRFLGKLAAAVIDADPDAAEAKRRAEAMRQFVATGQCNEYGLKTMILKAQAGDVICLNALFDRIARILQLEGDTDPYDVRKARATGIVANPFEAVRLLEKYATTTTDAEDAGEADSQDDPSSSAEEPLPMGEDSADCDDASGDSGQTEDTGPADAEPEPTAEPEAAADAPSEQPVGPDQGPGQVPDRGQAVLDLFGDRRIDPHEPTADALRSQGHGPGAGHNDYGSASGSSAHSASSGSPPNGGSRPGAGPPGRLRPGDLHPADDDSADPPVPACAARPSADRCPTCGGTGAPAAVWRRVDPDRLLPHATLYVHVSQDSFLRGTGGVARFENGIGPVTIEQAVAFLGHRRVTVKPVIDLARQVPVDGYEVPARLREAVRLARPASVFPYSSSTAPSLDLDHTEPYLPLAQGGKKGQTGLHNLAPLQRFEHRVKTHARGWVHRQPEPGVYLWRNRYGYWYRVDHTGTHPLGKRPDLTAHHPNDEQTGQQTEALRALRDAGTPPAGRSPLETAFAQLLHA